MKNNKIVILVFTFIFCVSTCSSSNDVELTVPPTDNSGGGSDGVVNDQTDYDILVRNPVVQTWYTPDPAPMVYKDTLFLFVDHDEDDADYFYMKDWQLYSTTDLINWTYRGTPMSTATFTWARQGDKAWAAQAIERNGKFYWYMCAQDDETGADALGVAVSDSPVGPYHDPLGKPLAPPTWGYIDPTVFIDDDGQAYLFWGNNNLWYAKLVADMISFEGDIHQIDVMDEEAFGPIIRTQNEDGSIKLKTNYEEGSWLYKRNELTVELNLETGGLSFFDKKSAPLLKEAGTAHFIEMNDAGSKAFWVKQAFVLDKDEPIYGLGNLENGRLSQRGEHRTLMPGNVEDGITFFSL